MDGTQQRPIRAVDILPMRAPERIYAPFSDDAFLMELKVDGWRCRAGFGGGLPFEMFTSSSQPCATWFPEVVDVLARLPGGPWVADGELAILDDLGRASFARMQERGRRRRWVAGLQVIFVVFDLMVAEGRSVMHLELIERKALLRDVLSTAGRTTVLYLGDFPAQADLLDRVVVPLGLEGLMAKRKASTYQPGVRSADWRKIKPRSEEFRRAFRSRFGSRTE